MNTQKNESVVIRKKDGMAFVGRSPDHGELEDGECRSGERGRERVAVW